MAFKRKSTRNPPRARKWRRRSTARPRMSRSMTGAYTRPVHRFRRCQDVDVLVGNAAFTPYQSYSVFTLDKLINYTEFTNLYDQYRIDYIVQKFYMRIDPSAQTAAASTFPALYWTRDYDSSVVLSQSDMRQRSNMKTAILRPDRPIVIKYKPNLLREVYANTLSTTYEPVWGRWLDCSNATATHFGHVWNINNFSNTNYRLEIETFVYISCKSVR